MNSIEIFSIMYIPLLCFLGRGGIGGGNAGGSSGSSFKGTSD
jgi:hypothetical protein